METISLPSRSVHQPGAVPMGLASGVTEGSTQACFTLRSGMTMPRPLKNARSSTSSAGSTRGVSPRTAQIVASGARFAAALHGRAGGPQARLLAGACDKGPARYGESPQYVVLAWVMRSTLQYMVSQVL